MPRKYNLFLNFQKRKQTSNKNTRNVKWSTCVRYVVMVSVKCTYNQDLCTHPFSPSLRHSLPYGKTWIRKCCTLACEETKASQMNWTIHVVLAGWHHFSEPLPCTCRVQVECSLFEGVCNHWCYGKHPLRNFLQNKKTIHRSNMWALCPSYDE